MKLFLCSACGRHVKECSAACPFCGAAVAKKPCLDSATIVRRLSRAALLTGASTMLAASACSSYGQGPFCPHEVDFSAPCGFESVSTTCAGATMACDHQAGGTGLDVCTIVGVTASCSFTAKLADGMPAHTIAITVGSRSGCPSDPIISPTGGWPAPKVDFTAPTCKQPNTADASSDTTDETDAPFDAADDAVSDADLVPLDAGVE